MKRNQFHFLGEGIVKYLQLKRYYEVEKYYICLEIISIKGEHDIIEEGAAISPTSILR